MPLFLALVLCGAARAVEKGEYAPTFSLPTTEGTISSLDDIRGGGALILDFGSVFCSSCQEALMILADIRAEYSARGLGVAAVNIDPENSARAVASIAGKLNLGYPVLRDPKEKVMSLYGISGIPTVVLIDSRGIVRAVHTGPLPEFRDKVLPGLQFE